jgi:hypothetical protein
MSDCLLCNIPTRLARNNSSCVYPRPHSGTFSWFRANTFLLLCISAAYAAIEPVVVILFSQSCASCVNGSVRLMKVYQRLLLFVLYVTDECVLNFFTVLVVCHWWPSLTVRNHWHKKHTIEKTGWQLLVQ